MLLVVGYLWLAIRRTIPKEGKAYPRARIQHEHKFMIAMACVVLPCILATFAIDRLDLPHPAWFFAGTYAVFFSLLLVVLGRLERAYRLTTDADATNAKPGESKIG